MKPFVCFAILAAVLGLWLSPLNAAERPDLSGTWYDYSPHTGNTGHPSTVQQNGDRLTFINEFNDRSDGYFIDDQTVIATKWQGGLRANLRNNNQQIAFTNGSMWERSKRNKPQDNTGTNLGNGLTEYQLTSTDQDPYNTGTGQELNMGVHRYCALSYVLAGGFNSSCRISVRGGAWYLIAVDPRSPDQWTGESQGCAAICTDK